MRRVIREALVIAAVITVPRLAAAQASIAGTVKDSSGGVLPGVTVEASSPALIERSRSVVTDGTGQYKIVDLRPGTYTVTFTLAGFNTVKRDGIELTGSFTNVNADLKVGAVEESITVTGETPVNAQLPGGGGYLINGLYDVNPAKFTTPADQYLTLADNYGNQIEHWNDRVASCSVVPYRIAISHASEALKGLTRFQRLMCW